MFFNAEFYYPKGYYFLFAIFTCNLHNTIARVYTVCVKESHSGKGKWQNCTG